MLLLSPFFISYAQQEDKTLRFEPYLGVAVTNLTKSGLHSKTALSIGVNIQYRLSNKLRLVSGLELANYGAKDDHAKLELGYINVPVMAKYYVYKGVALCGGIRLGYNVTDRGTDFWLFSAARKIVFDIPIGISCDFKRISVTGQYFRGLAVAYKDFNYKNRGLRLTVGYKI